MSMILNIPDKNQAQVKTVTLEASTTVDGEKKETEFSYDLPSTLEDAIAIEGTKGIFRRVINAMVIEAQGEERRKLAATSGGKERVRAKYLEQFDL